MSHRVTEKPGAAPAPAEVPAASPAKKLDNLFFIEEPKPAHATESESHEHNTQHSIHSTQYIIKWGSYTTVQVNRCVCESEEISFLVNVCNVCEVVRKR